MRFSNSIVSFILFLVLTINNAFSKDIKPKVLIYGDNIEAFAAAIQSARSGVPTIWVLPSSSIDVDFIQASWNRERKISGGIWMNILQEASLRKEKSDSILLRIQKELSPVVLQQAMDKMIVGEKNLTLLKGEGIHKLENAKKKIEVILLNKRKIDVLTVVDTSPAMDLISLVGPVISKSNFSTDISQFSGPLQTMSKDYIRTILAIKAGDSETIGYTQQEMLSHSNGNIFFTAKMLGSDSARKNIPFKCNLGQVVGASAAYCAFFKTASANIDVRKLQTELLLSEAHIIPFEDVHNEDPNYNALQRVFLVNILPWDRVQQPLHFNPTDSVAVASVKSALQQLYSRAQLWYIDNKTMYFTVKDMIELLKVISFRGNELDDEVQKSWNKRFKFAGSFDPQHIINRYEFAVLLDAYAAPFSRRVSLEGVIQR